MNAEKDAAALLEATWSGRGMPVDPVQIADQLGLDVLVTDLPEDVSGALIKERDQDPVILLNQGDSRNRQRFTCAHELGHYIQKSQNDGEDYEYIDLRGQLAKTGQDTDEVYANNFAANLLMPKAAVCALHEQKVPSFIMALKFQVSDDAMRYRLKNLGLRR